MGKKSESGQAILEYIILLSIILTMTGTILTGVMGVRDKMWKKIICEVSAPCPSCQATATARQLLPRAGGCPN